MLPSAAERPPATVLDWETGAGKSYYIPAFEILGFSLALNLFDRLFLDEKTYSTDWRDWSRNLRWRLNTTRTRSTSTRSGILLKKHELRDQAMLEAQARQYWIVGL